MSAIYAEKEIRLVAWMKEQSASATVTLTKWRAAWDRDLTIHCSSTRLKLQ